MKKRDYELIGDAHLSNLSSNLPDGHAFTLQLLPLIFWKILIEQIHPGYRD